MLDQSGAVIQRTLVFLESETDSSRRYLTRTDARGIYRLSELPADVYWLWFKQNGFREFVFKAVQLAKGEEKSIPPVTSIVVKNGWHAGNLVGTVVEHSKVPPAGAAPTPFAVPNLPTSYTPVADADVSLICDGDRVCSKIRTDPRGGFVFEGVAPGKYGLLIGRYFFYSLFERSLEVRQDLELIYGLFALERCPEKYCGPARRPKHVPTKDWTQIIICE